MNDNTRISGSKTVGDWKRIRNKIRENPKDQVLLNEAFDFFYKRLETRYFKPIHDIMNNDTRQGEGFAIMTILCSLIEFLESTWTGEIYRFCKDNQLQSYEYNGSKQKFINFFEKRYPFNSVFTPINGLANEFYTNVRCGLLHEACTKLNWTIRTSGQKDFYEYTNGENIINRLILEQRIRESINSYKQQLMKDIDLQNAFIRKMNNIAGLTLNY